MPNVRCMSCKRLVPKKLSRRGRCQTCAKVITDERKRQHRSFGPCPQVGLCGYCQGLHGPATAANPYIWGHWPTRFIDGGTNVVPIHKHCNESLQKRK